MLMGSGCWGLVAGCWGLVAGCWMLVACWVFQTSIKHQATGNKQQAAQQPSIGIKLITPAFDLYFFPLTYFTPRGRLTKKQKKT
jgi:hypothetical protein